MRRRGGMNTPTHLCLCFIVVDFAVIIMTCVTMCAD